MSGQRKHEDVNGLSDEELQIERLLAGLAPRDSRINRDWTMFAAGEASAFSRAPRSPKRRWVWPAIAVCSTAAGLLAGVLITSGQGLPVVARQTPAGEPTAQRSITAAPVAQRSIAGALGTHRSIGLERRASDREESLVVSPALLELRVAMLSRAGDESLLTKADLVTGDQPLEPGVARAASFAPMTYGAFLGRLHEEEKHL
jgi:hypothetical protein